MLITTLASLIAALTFLAAMLFATVSDLRSRRIPNWLVSALALVYAPLAIAAGFEAMDVVINFAGAIVIFVAGVLCFSRGWIGGGDVKLGSVVVLWLAIELAPAFLLVSAVFGALFTLAAMVGVGLLARSGRGMATLREDGVPYGPGLACAALLLFQVSPWANALT